MFDAHGSWARCAEMLVEVVRPPLSRVLSVRGALHRALAQSPRDRLAPLDLARGDVAPNRAASRVGCEKSWRTQFATSEDATVCVLPVKPDQRVRGCQSSDPRAV